MFCEVCGAQLPDDARFCKNCGNPVMPVSDLDPGSLQLAAFDQTTAPAEPEITETPDYSAWNAVINFGRINGFTEDSVPNMLQGILNDEIEFFLLVPPGYAVADYTVDPPGLIAVNYIVARASDGGGLAVDICNATGSVSYEDRAGGGSEVTLRRAFGISVEDALQIFMVYMREHRIADAPGPAGWEIVNTEII